MHAYHQGKVEVYKSMLIRKKIMRFEMFEFEMFINRSSSKLGSWDAHKRLTSTALHVFSDFNKGLNQFGVR